MSTLKQTAFIETFFSQLQLSLSAPELDVRVSAAESFAKFLRSLSPNQAVQVLQQFMHYALDIQELALKGPQELHGLMHAFAEIVRQRIYKLTYELDEFFGKISTFWKHCLYFEARQTVIAPTLSALVRDTACYFAWAIAKFTKNQDSLQKISHQIISELVCIALFDCDVNCRRASAACLQQWLGRCNFEGGVELIQRINFTSVSQGKSAFTALAQEVAAEFPLLRSHMVNHLLHIKRLHRDEKTRRMAAEVFSTLLINVPIPQEITAALIMDMQKHDPIIFHGSLYFFSSILAQLHDAPIMAFDPNEPFISNSPHYELLIDCHLNYVLKICAVRKLCTEHILSFSNIIFSVCQRKSANDSLKFLWRKATFECLQLLSKSCSFQWEPFIDKYWQLFTDTFHYPYFYVVASLGTISICRQESLVEIYEKASVDLKIEILFAIKRAVDKPLMQSFVHDLIALAVEDYTLDRRGDIGSLVRMEALEIVYQFAKDKIYYDDLFPKIFRICLEKMQKLHSVAWNSIVLYPQFQAIQKYFPLIPKDSLIDYRFAIQIVLCEGENIARETLIGFLRAFASNILYIQEPVYKAIFETFHQERTFDLDNFVWKVISLSGMLPAKLALLEYLLDKFSLFISQRTLAGVEQFLQNLSIPVGNFKLYSRLINIYFLLGCTESLRQMTNLAMPTLSDMARQYLELTNNFNI